MAQLLRFDGTCDEVFPADPKAGFSLSEAYTLIGCEIVQAIYLEDGRIMLVDEEGNHRAARALRNGTEFLAYLLPEAETLALLRSSMSEAAADFWWWRMSSFEPHPGNTSDGDVR